MSNKLYIIGCLLIIVTSSGCEYDKTVKKEIPAIVSLNKDVVPIFNSSCNTAGCHSANQIPPDLSAGGAFLSLTSGGFVIDTIPKNSNLYLRMRDKTKPMPPSGLLSEDDIKIIETWIKTGAQDN